MSLFREFANSKSSTLDRKGLEKALGEILKPVDLGEELEHSPPEVPMEVPMDFGTFDELVTHLECMLDPRLTLKGTLSDELREVSESGRPGRQCSLRVDFSDLDVNLQCPGSGGVKPSEDSDEEPDEEAFDEFSVVKRDGNQFAIIQGTHEHVLEASSVEGSDLWVAALRWVAWAKAAFELGITISRTVDYSYMAEGLNVHHPKFGTCALQLRFTHSEMGLSCEQGATHYAETIEFNKISAVMSSDEQLAVNVQGGETLTHTFSEGDTSKEKMQAWASALRWAMENHQCV